MNDELEKRIEEALAAIEKVFSVTTVSAREIQEVLTAIIDEIQNYIDTLQRDIDN